MSKATGASAGSSSGIKWKEHYMSFLAN